MASATKTNRGRWIVRFKNELGERKTISLAKLNKSAAQEIARHATELENSLQSGAAVPMRTSDWLGEISQPISDKLAKAGLIRARRNATLEAFLDLCIRERADVAPSTRAIFMRARNKLVAFFGPQKMLRDITRADADRFRVGLAKDLSPNSIRQACRYAKHFFPSGREGSARKLQSLRPSKGTIDQG